MNGYEVYKTYLALKTHFTTKSYDFFKHNGRTRAKYNTYTSRKDVKLFEKIAKKYSKDFIIKLMISNLASIDNFYIGDIEFNEETYNRFKKWKSKTINLKLTFKQDCEKIRRVMNEENITFNDVFKPINGEYHPRILNMIMNEEFSLESFVIMTDIFKKIIPRFDKLYLKGEVKDEMWKIIRLKTTKYKPFLIYNLEDYIKIFKNIFKGENV